MDSEFVEPSGEIVDPSAISISKAKELLVALQDSNIEYCNLVECRSFESNDVIVIDVEVELGQKRVHDIRPAERIAVQFEKSDTRTPKAFALRSDFPFVPHINITVEEFPRELCLYASPYSELKRQWTPSRFVERIRDWLALTAKGKLHQNDQPLEPLLWGSEGNIVLPLSLIHI